MSSTESKPGLYLIVDGATPAAFAVLTATLDAAPIATVLLPATEAATLARLVALAQSRGAAALVADDARLARTVGADGVHLSWAPDLAQRYAAARAALGGDAIVGVEAGGFRHDAMVLGEAGADYIAFVPLHETQDDDGERSALQADLIAWWSELFEVPCVAFGTESPEAAAALAAEGADFIAVSLPAAADPAGAAALVTAIATALPSRHAAGRAAG